MIIQFTLLCSYECLSQAGNTTAGASEHARSLQYAWRAQANMWLALCDVLIDSGRLADVWLCVDQALRLFPNTHHALYLKVCC
jgi:hypothetical protein